MLQMLRSKRGIFRDFTRGLTLGNSVVIILLGMFLLYFGNFLLNRFFDFDIIPLGTPFRILLIVLAIGTAFYVVVRKQGSLDRSDIFSIILISGGFGLLVYYLPVLAPELFKQAVYSNPDSPVNMVYNTVQSILPAP